MNNPYILAVVAADEWPNPQKIHPRLYPVEALEPIMLPDALRAWVIDIADRVQCPADFVGAAAVVMIASVVGSGCGIRPKAEDDWLVIPNLWGALVGAPSSGKSPAIAEVMKPLLTLEREAMAEHSDALRMYNAEMAMHDATKQALRRRAVGDDSAALDAKNRFLGLSDPKKPTCRRYKSNDATVEKLTELLAENERGLLILRDELVGLLTTWDKEGHESDRAFFLESWNGFGSHITDRIGRGTTFTDNLCLSVFGGIQQQKLLSYLHRAMRGGQNDGLIQRLQILVYPDDHRSWKLVDRAPNVEARQRAFDVVKKIATMKFSQHGAEGSVDDRIPYFRFTGEAQDTFYDWWTTLEQVKLRDASEPILAEHLGKYRSLMPSLALLFHLVDLADGKPSGRVDVTAARRAAAWCSYLETHARRTYGLVTERIPTVACKLSEKIAGGTLSTRFSVREVYRKNWEFARDRDAIHAACELLRERGWLRAAPLVATAGRPASPTYDVNPKVLLDE